MRAIRVLPTHLQHATSTFPEFRKRGNDDSTLFRTALLVPLPKSDLSLLGFGRRHELPDRIDHDLELSVVFIPGLACLLHFLRQDLIDERLIRQSLLLSVFAQPTQDFRV